jgi:cytochrome bd-type quinol oxidase subunit 2
MEERVRRARWWVFAVAVVSAVCRSFAVLMMMMDKLSSLVSVRSEIAFAFALIVMMRFGAQVSRYPFHTPPHLDHRRQKHDDSEDAS